MQPEKSANYRIFIQSQVDSKDELEEKFERCRSLVGRLGGNGSEKEIHDALTAAAHRDKQTHDDVCFGLLGHALIENKELGLKYYRDLTFISRDNLAVCVDILIQIILEKFQKLTKTARSQLLWITGEMVKGGINAADMLCWNIMRQIAGGDVSVQNLTLIEFMLDIYLENRAWLYKHQLLTGAVIYTYLRVLEDHFSESVKYLRQKEVQFVCSVIRDNFTEVVLNHQIGLGRDFIRLLQNIARIPEIGVLWNEILYNPRSLSPHFTGIAQILSCRTSRKFLQGRLTPDMEKKIMFLTFQVKFGHHKRYQDWFQKQYFSTAESQSLRTDIIRYIVCVIHPPNEILCSDILPRWAVIGWLLATCTNSVAAANAKFALLFDWLLFDSTRDNIMLIEPAILVMYHSMKSHLAITATLLDFLIRLMNEYWPSELERVKSGVKTAFLTILEKRVMGNLEPLLENPKLEPELRKSIQDNLLALINGNGGPPGGGSNDFMNNVGENHNSTGSLLGNIGLPIVTHRASPPPNLNLVSSNTSNNCLFDAVSSNLTNSNNNNNNGLPKILRGGANTNTASLPTATPAAVADRDKESPTVDFSDDSPDSSEDSEDEDSRAIISTTITPAPVPPKAKTSSSKNNTNNKLFPVPAAAAGNAAVAPTSSAGGGGNGGNASRSASNSPPLGASVEEAERAMILDKIYGLDPNMRIPFESMVQTTVKLGSKAAVTDNAELLAEVLGALVDEQIDKERREDVSKCLLYLYKSELSKPCFNEETNSVVENLRISPISELLELVVNLKPTDKSLKMKNVMRVLSDMATNLPSTAYKILLILNQMFEKDPKREDLRGNRNSYESLYKNLGQLRGLKLEAMIHTDLKVCYETEPGLMATLYPCVYSWYDDDVALTGSHELLRFLVASVDPSQLQALTWYVMQEYVVFFDENTLVPVLLKTLEWETWEQHCVWTLISAHTHLRIDDFLSLIPQLDPIKNPEAMTSLLLLLRREVPTADIVSVLFCRRPNSKDNFVVSVLRSWVASSHEELAEVLASVLIKASGGSPAKRKRGPGGSRGTASPAGLPSPSTENVLAHLDNLRSVPTMGISDADIFNKDIMVAALSQVQSWVSDSQRNKYKDLLSIAVEDSDDKEPITTNTKSSNSGSGEGGRSSSSNSTSGGRDRDSHSSSSSTKRSSSNSSSNKKHPASPGSGSSNSKSSSSSTNTSSASTDRHLPRTLRSGKTRTPIKPELLPSSESSEEDEDIPRPKKAKTRKRMTTVHSDSD